jgi:hypothetical protein
VRPSTITKRRIDPGIDPDAGPQPVPARPASNPLWKRRLASWSRWLHVYLSLVSFAILFFFAVTGLTLNHQQWFAKQQKTTQFRGHLDPALLKGSVEKLEVVEHLRASHRISSAVSEFRVDDQQCSVSFKGPGYTADVFIDRESGSYDVTETKMGLAAVLNDLHKGRDSGNAWGWVIDGSAIFMTFVSLTGIVLLLFLQKRRFSGLMAGAVGALLCYVVYLVWVP